MIRLSTQENYTEAIVTKFDEYHDSAVIKIIYSEQYSEFKPIELGNSDNLSIGDICYAIGNAGNLSISMSRGIIGSPSIKLVVDGEEKTYIQLHCYEKSKVTIPAMFNLKPITRINQFSLIGYNGGVAIIDISHGVEFISTYAFYGSNAIRYINIPTSISAVNYHGFYDLDNLEIHVKASEKPSNWDSTWYYSVINVLWNSQINGNVSSDGLYFYTYSGNNAKIVKYFGSWSSSLPLIIPSTIDGYTVTAIGTSAITYSSSSTTLEVVIPNTVTTIDNQAIYYYRYLSVFSNLVSKPAGWISTFGYNYYNGSSSETYCTYYWQGAWSLVNNDPTLN